MSNYIYTNEGLVNADDIMHYGVPGMKWGHRKANPYAKRIVRGHAGPGRYITTKRQLAGDKRDLEALNKGQHLSVGLTKKRQAAYDAKDRARLEKRIAKNEKKLLEKEYGKLEDQLTYGKKADAKKNAKITKKMNAIEKKLNDMDKTDKKSLSEKQKIAIAVGATAVATGLAAYGAHKLSNVIKDRSYTKAMDAGKKSVESFIDNFGAKPYDIVERMSENQRFAYEDYGRSATKAIKNAISNNYAKGRGVDWKRVYGYFK